MKLKKVSKYAMLTLTASLIFSSVNNASKFSDNIGIKFPIIELSS